MAVNDDNSKYDEASALIGANRWNEALPLLLDLMRTSKYYDTWHQTHYLVGQCYRFTDQIEKAINELEKCVGLIRHDADSKIYGSCYLALGIAYQLNGQYARAIHNLTLGFQKDPDNHLIDNSVGLTYRLMGNYDMALQAYTHSYGILINNALETLKLGPLSSDRKERQDQLTDLLQSGKLKPVLASNLDFSIVCHNIGLLDMLLDNPMAALMTLEIQLTISLKG